MCSSQRITTTNKLEPVSVVIFAQDAFVRSDVKMSITDLPRIRDELLQLSKEKRRRGQRRRRTQDLRRLSDDLSEIIEEIERLSGRPTTASRLRATSTDESESPQAEIERSLGIFTKKKNTRAKKAPRLRAASTTCNKSEAPQAATEGSLRSSCTCIKNENDQARKASCLRAALFDEEERHFAMLRKRVADFSDKTARAWARLRVGDVSSFAFAGTSNNDARTLFDRAEMYALRKDGTSQEGSD